MSGFTPLWRDLRDIPLKMVQVRHWGFSKLAT
jgi:hypothetical protein